MSYGKSGPAQGNNPGTSSGGMPAGFGMSANTFMPQPLGSTADQQPLSNQIASIGSGQQGLVSMLGQNAVPTSSPPGTTLSSLSPVMGMNSQTNQPAFSGTQDTAGMAQQFPNLMQNPAFNPQAQLQQQITQARDAGAFAGAGSSNSFPAAPQPFQPAPIQMPTPPRVNMDFLRQPGQTPPPQVQAPFSPPPRVNMDFLRQPPAPMPTQATQGYVSRIAPAAPSPVAKPVVKPAPKPVVRAPAPAPAPKPVAKPVVKANPRSSVSRLGR